MVVTIVATGSGASSKASVLRVSLVHALGSMIGGGVAGMALGFSGDWILGPRVSLGLQVLIGLLALLLAGIEGGIWRLRLPKVRRQVPNAWRRRFPRVWAVLLYGLGLGVGVATHARSYAIYVLAAWIFATLDPLEGAAVLASYGLARGLMTARISWTAKSSRWVEERLRFIDEWRDIAERAVSISLAVFGIATVVYGSRSFLA